MILAIRQKILTRYLQCREGLSLRLYMFKENIFELAFFKVTISILSLLPVKLISEYMLAFV